MIFRSIFSSPLAFCLFMIASCSSAHETQMDEKEVDITGEIFQSSETDCAEYANKYKAVAKDEQTNINLYAQISVTVQGNKCAIQSNSVPNHNFNSPGAHFVTPVTEINTAFTITRDAKLAKSTTPLSQRSYDAIMLNGVVLDILSAGCFRPTARNADRNGNVAIGCNVERDQWILDPLSKNAGFGADDHNAHTQPDGRYHYHGNPMALFDDNPGPNGSPVIGFAADGFPIFGSFFKDKTGAVRKATSGYSLRTGQRPTGSNNPSGKYDGMYVDDYVYNGLGDLDECNGMTVNGQYGYYVTDNFPWVLRCFKGAPDASFEKGPRR